MASTHVTLSIVLIFNQELKVMKDWEYCRVELNGDEAGGGGGPFTKNCGKFPLGISVWRERVPFITSSIRGSRGRPGRLIDRERHGTGDEGEKSVNGTQISIGKFPPGKRDYLFRNSVYSGKFPVERTKKSCSIYIPTGISGNFCKWKTLGVTRY